MPIEFHEIECERIYEACEILQSVIVKAAKSESDMMPYFSAIEAVKDRAIQGCRKDSKPCAEYGKLEKFLRSR